MYLEYSVLGKRFLLSENVELGFSSRLFPSSCLATVLLIVPSLKVFRLLNTLKLARVKSLWPTIYLALPPRVMSTFASKFKLRFCRSVRLIGRSTLLSFAHVNERFKEPAITSFSSLLRCNTLLS